MEQNFTFAFPNSLFNPKDFQCVIKPSIDFLKHLSGLDFRLLQNQIENAKFAYDQDNKQILTDEYFTIFYYCYDFINKKMNSGESKQ